MIGGSEQKERFDHLRRRMEGDAGRATGVDTGSGGTGEGAQRRGWLGGVADTFRGTG